MESTGPDCRKPTSFRLTSPGHGRSSYEARCGNSEEGADAAAPYASDESSWCTGTSLVHDGGFVSSLT